MLTVEGYDPAAVYLFNGGRLAPGSLSKLVDSSLNALRNHCGLATSKRQLLGCALSSRSTLAFCRHGLGSGLGGGSGLGLSGNRLGSYVGGSSVSGGLRGGICSGVCIVGASNQAASQCNSSNGSNNLAVHNHITFLILRRTTPYYAYGAPTTTSHHTLMGASPPFPVAS